MNAAFNRRDRDALFAYYHPDVELRDLQHAPDAPERLIGIDAIRAYWDQWDDAFDDFTAEIEEYLDGGHIRPDGYPLAWQGQGQWPGDRPACRGGRRVRRRQDRSAHERLLEQGGSPQSRGAGGVGDRGWSGVLCAQA